MTTSETSPPQTAQERWAKTRTIGRSAFIWRYGVILWGLPVATITACYHVIQLHARGAAWSLAEVRPMWQSIVGIMIACGIIGYLFGAWLWDACESHFSPPPSPPAAPSPHSPSVS
jgi:hypothetical protein